MNIDISKDFTAAQTHINDKIENLKDTKTPLMQIVVEMFSSVGQNFREQGTDKGKWEPLAESTLKGYMRRKGKRGKGPFVLLQDKGTLKNSIGQRIEGDTAVVSTNMRKAPALHFGYEKRNLPGRLYLYIREDAVQRIFAIGRAWGFGA